jgi:hypothetical protein
MFRLSDAHHFRKTIAGLCMGLGPLCLLASTLVFSDLKVHEGPQIAAVAAHADRFYIAVLLAFVGVVLVLPAVLGLMHMLRDRMANYGHVGGALALIGLLAIAGAVAVAGMIWQMVDGSAARGDMVDLLYRFNHTAETAIPFAYLPLGLGVGMIVLAAGLYRARVVAPWQALMLAVGPAAFVVAYPTAVGALAIGGAAVMFVGFATVGQMVLAETDEEWEHTPEYRGFHPLAGAR